jgi:hypothetical protein
MKTLRNPSSGPFQKKECWIFFSKKCFKCALKKKKRGLSNFLENFFKTKKRCRISLQISLSSVPFKKIVKKIIQNTISLAIIITSSPQFRDFIPK